MSEEKKDSTPQTKDRPKNDEGVPFDPPPESSEEETSDPDYPVPGDQGSR